MHPAGTGRAPSVSSCPYVQAQRDVPLLSSLLLMPSSLHSKLGCVALLPTWLWSPMVWVVVKWPANMTG
jgi:hypothetical protein